MKKSTMVVLVLGLACVGAASAGGASAAKASTCALGQKTSKAKPCTANAAYGAGACKSLEATLQPLAPGMSIVGSNKNAGAPSFIDCWFQANGKKQSFDIQVTGGADGPANYKSGLAQYTGYSKDPTTMCSSGAAQAPLQMVSGLGDKAFAWQSCAPGETGFILAQALKGTTSVYVLANPFDVNPSLSQVEGLVRQLLAKFH